MMSSRSNLLFVAISGFLLVAFGAFGAHVLTKILGTQEMAWIHTGLEYQAWHTLAILGLSCLRPASRWFDRSAGLLAVGVVLFSGSLYALALTHLKFLVFITPLGGLCFLAGWLLMLIGALRLKQRADCHE